MKKGGPEFVKRAPEGLSLFKITPPKACSFFAPRGAMWPTYINLQQFHKKHLSLSWYGYVQLQRVFAKDGAKSNQERHQL